MGADSLRALLLLAALVWALVALLAVPPQASRVAQLRQPSAQLLVGVISQRSAGGLERRNAIRKSWALFALGHDVLVRFVVGVQCDGQCSSDAEHRLQLEQRAFGDLLLVPCADDYAHLLCKTIELMRWADGHRFEHLIKVSALASAVADRRQIDDDVFLRLDTIIDELPHRPKRALYWGFIYRMQPKIIGKRSKHYDPLYHSDVYPPFCSGICYILSHDLVHWIVANLASLARYPNEDTSVGVWLSALNVTYLHDFRFQILHKTCFEDIVAKHEMEAEHMQRMYENVLEGNICKGFWDTQCPIGYLCFPDQTQWELDFVCTQQGCRGTSEREKAERFNKTAPLVEMAPALAAACPKMKIAGTRLVPNLLLNGELKGNSQGQVSDWTPMEDFCSLASGVQARWSHSEQVKSAHALLCSSDTSGIIFGIRQRVKIDEPSDDALLLSAWSRAVNVSGETDDYYAVSTVLFHVDGSKSFGMKVLFDTGTHDWQHRFVAYKPQVAVREIEVRLAFTRHSGDVWFDDVRVAPLHECKYLSTDTGTGHRLTGADRCQISRHYVYSQVVDIANERDLPARRLVHAVWTRRAADFGLLERLTIESVVRVLPSARVRVHSDSLPLHWFAALWEAGYDVRVVRIEQNTACDAAADSQACAARALSAALMRGGGLAISFGLLLMAPLPDGPLVGAHRCTTAQRCTATGPDGSGGWRVDASLVQAEPDSALAAALADWSQAMPGQVQLVEIASARSSAGASVVRLDDDTDATCRLYALVRLSDDLPAVCE